MNRREPQHPRSPERSVRQPAQPDAPQRPVPATDYPYGPSFSQSGGSYVDTDTGRTLPQESGPYQRLRPWGPQDGIDAGASDQGGNDDRGYGPDIEPPRDFRGRGPRGYVRSDERLKELICERLSDDPRIDASDVTVDVTGGRVSLSGEVDSRRSKHLLEDIVDACGVESIDNRLRIAGRHDASA
jgi:hypothetical protein